MASMPDEPDDFLDYQTLIQDALRAVVQEALDRVAEEGFPGEHHFYLSFRSDDPDVLVPAFLRDRYPEEITIVLQHQFWNLEVDDEGFSVELTFEAARERIAVPWQSLTAFVDPAAEFALRFAPEIAEDDAVETGGEGDAETDTEAAGSADATAEVVNIRHFQPKDS